MRSHFAMNRSAAMACAVAGAATMLNGRCAAQSYIAADYATNSIYNTGWTSGQNGGNGFGAWSFNATDNTPAGEYQAITSSSALGTAWTLLVHSSSSGLANVGRAIPGGLQVGQTFQTVIQNPINNAGIYSYRGFDILFTGGTDNNPGGVNTAALRLTVFDYFNPAMNWAITDADNPGGFRTSASGMTTGASGMLIALTLNTTNTYTVTMSPVSDPANPYVTHSGTLTTNLPISFVNFRLWNTASSGGTDTADNLEISSMSILGVEPPMLSVQASGTNIVLSWSTNFSNFILASSPSLASDSVWSTNLPAPVVVGGQNYVTNPISGPQQFYRLQATQ